MEPIPGRVIRGIGEWSPVGLVVTGTVVAATFEPRSSVPRLCSIFGFGGGVLIVILGSKMLGWVACWY